MIFLFIPTSIALGLIPTSHAFGIIPTSEIFSNLFLLRRFSDLFLLQIRTNSGDPILYIWDECRDLESTIGYEMERNIHYIFHHPNPLDCSIKIV